MKLLRINIILDEYSKLSVTNLFKISNKGRYTALTMNVMGTNLETGFVALVSLYIVS